MQRYGGAREKPAGASLGAVAVVYGVVVGLDEVKRHALANEPGGLAAPVAARLGCSCAAEHLGELRGDLLDLLPVVGVVVGGGRRA